MSLSYQQEGEKISMHSRQRPMYHYLYGSVGNQPAGPGAPMNLVGNMATADETGNLLNTSVETADSAATPHTTDQDSLVGEGFIPTDTEDESDRLREGRGDFQQLLMTNGGGGLNSFLGRGGTNKDGRRTWGSYCQMLSPVLYFVSLLMLVAVLSCAIALVVFPKRATTSSDIATSTQASSESSFRMSFSRANRADYGDGVEQFVVKDLFHPDLHYQGSDPARSFIFPFPTGAFWTNLVLPPTQNQGLSFPVVAYPYGFKWSDTLMQVSYSYAHRKEEAKAIHDYFYPDLTFSCEETVSGRHVTAFDPLSVALQYETAKKGLWSVFLVQGSPYINMEFGSVTPVITAFTTFDDIGCPPIANYSFVGNKKRKRRLDSGYGVCYEDSDSDTGVKTLHGVQFVLSTSEGWHWMIFTSEPLSLQMDTRIRTKVRATEPYNGAFRAAIIPNRTLDDLSMSSGVQRLINHAGIYPIHGDVTWSFTSASTSKSGFWSGGLSNSTETKRRVATVSIKFKTRSFVPTTSATAPKPLLMLALPHHAAKLSPSVLLGPKGFDFSYNTIKGPMTPILGTEWTYDQPLLSPGFDNDVGSNNNSMYLNPTVKSALVENLIQDINIALPTKTENIYGFGKQAARLAQLVHIASRLVANETASGNVTESGSGTTVSSLLNQATNRLSSALEAFFTDGVSDKLVYDANLGGLVTTDGLLDSGADFGNGRYNDHHFHYGYILYASAIMAKRDSSFLAKYKSKIDAVYYDVAHNANFDSRRRGEGIFFPAARHMNWFDGHSYASGLFPFGNGKSQESSSEAVNCYYGAYLWSLVRNGAGENPEKDTSAQTDFTRLLLSFEVTGAQTYWHMIPPSPSNKTTSRPKVYSDNFSRNYMVGNVGMNDAICSTWFGTEALYVHMINFLPVTSAAGELFLKEYATIEYKNVLASLGEIDTAWRGFVIANHAISDPVSAWKDAQQVSSAQLDSGLSKTQLLYWISSRQGFLPEEKQPSGADAENQSGDSSPSSEPPNAAPTSASASGSESCSQNKRCVAAGLTGMCCPTIGGVNLDCCD